MEKQDRWAKLVAASDHPYTLRRLEKTSWWSLLERAQRGLQLQELRRFLYHPRLTFLENQLRLLEFLRWLGRARRWQWRSNLGLLVYGEPGVGKSFFLQMLAATVFGQGNYCFISNEDLNSRFGLQGTESAEALILDDVKPNGRSNRLCQRLKELMSGLPVEVDRRHKQAQQVEFQQKLFLLGSDHSPEKLWGKYEHRESLDNRFPLQLELVNRPRNTASADGWDLKELEKEMDEVLVYALFFSSPEMEKDLNVLLKAASHPQKKWRQLDRRLR